MADKRKNLLMITPEFYGDTMVGGMAMATSGLANALLHLDMNVDVLLPAYKHSYVDSEIRFTDRLEVDRGKALEVKSKSIGNIPVHKVIGLKLGGKFSDSYTAFDDDNLPDVKPMAYRTMSKGLFHGFWRLGAAIPEAIRKAGIEKPDVIHVHEWPLASAVYWLSRDEELKDVPVLLTTHNANYAGVVPNLNESPRDLKLDSLYNTMLGSHIAVDGRAFKSLLEFGAYFADKVNTVSPNEAKEILDGREGVDPSLVALLKGKGLAGMINGIDSNVFDPRHDEMIETYDPSSSQGVFLGKMENKKALKTGFDVRFGRRVDNAYRGNYHESFNLDPTKMWVSMLARLSDQKSISEVVEAAKEISKMGGPQLLLMGEPENWKVRNELYSLRGTPNVYVYDEFARPELQHRVLASSDAILQASKWEPFGYTQLEGMVYGALPIVTDVGGYKDTMVWFNGNDDTGYAFKVADTTPGAIVDAVRDAHRLYRNPDRWAKARGNAVKEDFTWLGPKKPAKTYRETYANLMKE